MTVPSTPRRAGPFLGNGVTTSFPFTFKTFAAAYLQLTKTGTTGLESVLVLGSDYSVTLNPDQDISPGGTITYPITGSPLASGEKLTLLGDVDYDQTTDLLGGGAFNARVIEDTFDRVVIQIQQLDERVDRALIMSVGTTVSGQLPDAATRANKLLSFDSSGNPIVNAPSAGTATALAIDLASSAAANTGAGMIGYNSARSYGAGTVGKWINDLLATTGLALLSYLRTATGAVTRTLHAKLGDYVTPEDFGAVGDGATNDAVALAAACTFANAEGVFLEGRGKTYKCNAPIAFARKARNIRIDKSASTGTVSVSGYGAVNVGIYVDAGSKWSGSSTTLSGAENRGDNVIAVANAATIGAAIGDCILIHENVNWGSSGQAKASEGHVIQAVAGNNITLAGVLEGSYTSSATVRKWAAVDVEWDGVEVLDDGDTNTYGALILHARYVRLNRCGTNRTQYQGFGVIECFSLEVNGGFRANGAEDQGIGYGLNAGGTNFVVVDQIIGFNCKHVITTGSGFGPNYPLTRKLVVGDVLGYGCTDSAFDSHPGVVDCQVDQVLSQHRSSTSEGDGFVYQGSRLQVGSINVAGCKRDGALVQFYGDGDGLDAWARFGSVVVRAAGSSGQNAIALVNEGSDAFGGMSVGHIDSVAPRGIYVEAKSGDIGFVSFGDGKVEATSSTYHAAILLARAAGAIGGATFGTVTLKAAATGAGYYALYSAGFDATKKVDPVKLIGTTLIGGDYRVRVDQGALTHVAATLASGGSGTTLTGTGGTITAIT